MPNYEGKSQNRPKVNLTEELRQILQDYVNHNITKTEDILASLKKDHPEYEMGRSKLFTTMRSLGVHTARCRDPGIPLPELVAAVHRKMEDDPMRHRGPVAIKEQLAADGIPLPASFVRSVMRETDPKGFEVRDPHNKGKAVKHPGRVISLGPNHKWASDGHEKLALPMGFPVYGFRDYWGSILGFFVVPDSRDEYIVDYLYLLLVQKLGGIPECLTTDRGTETGLVYARQRSFRRVFGSHLDVIEFPDFIYLPSTDNIVIERSWRKYWDTEGKNYLVFWQRGQLDYGFDRSDTFHWWLACWIWVPLLQNETNKYVTRTNFHPVRLQPDKPGPSGTSFYLATLHPERHGGTDHLIPVSQDIMTQALHNHPGAEKMKFYPDWFDHIASQVFDKDSEPEITLHTAWLVWQEMFDSTLDLYQLYLRDHEVDN